MNDPNLYCSRLEMIVTVAVVGALAGWVGGVQSILYIYDGRTAPILGLWRLIIAYGPLLHPWGWKGYIPPITAGLVALAAGAAAWKLLTVASEHHIRGYILHRSPRPIACALRPGKGEAHGILVHPQIQIAQRQETYHFMVVGGTGAGKTTILWPWIQQAINRKDLVFIFDSKGDFTKKVPGPFTLLSPTDARSSRWIIGRDIRTKLEAHALAVTLIQEPPGGSKSDPFWIQGSRAIVSGLIVDLKTRFGEQWGLDHLAYECAAALSDFDRLKAVILREAPICITLLGGEEAEAPNRTALAFLSQIITSFTHIIHLGVSAHDLKANPGWSVRGWLASKTPATVVIGFRGEQSEQMSQCFAPSIIERVVRQCGGFPDAAPEQRRIWLCVDEAPVAGHIPSITTALTTLRSKGVRVILGFQSLAGVREKYSQDTAQIWEGQCDIKIIGKLGSVEDREWGSRFLGDREVERYQHQLSQESHSDAGGQHSGSWQRVREPVLLPSAFGQELGMQKDSRGRLKGPRALLLAAGEAAVLDWPLNPLGGLREPVIDARWIQSGYKPPVWGKPPLGVATPLLLRTGEQKTEAPKNESTQDRRTVTPATATPLPGAAMAAKILGMATGAASMPAVGPQGLAVTTTIITERGQDEHEQRDDQRE